MIEIHSEQTLRNHIESHQTLAGVAIQSVDLTNLAAMIVGIPVSDCLLLGCEIPTDLQTYLNENGAIVFPRLNGLPFQPFRASLYSSEELFNGFRISDPVSYCSTPDGLIYNHYLENGKASATKIRETLARRLHDHSVTDALHDFLNEMRPKRAGVVAIMGGHNMRRDSAAYRMVAGISRSLADRNYLMVSGGGPGAMEATHLGAWFVNRDEQELDNAISMLADFGEASDLPDYKQKQWLANAFRVMEKYPAEPGDRHVSLGIPTWLYGHEPPTPLATHIAKYFANSVREEGLITIATSGIIFSPGSFGTIQEIFQDAAQNHYAVAPDQVSPMVFLGKKYWQKRKPVYDLLQSLTSGEDPELGQQRNESQLKEFLTITDDPQEAIEFITTREPTPGASTGWSFCKAFAGG